MVPSAPTYNVLCKWFVDMYDAFSTRGDVKKRPEMQGHGHKSSASSSAFPAWQR